MKEMYSINDVAEMTGFTTRSLRNFIQMGFLDGEKIDGVWQFTAEEYEKFISNPNVSAGLKSKENMVVFDYLSDSEKENNRACVILDLKVHTVEEMTEISDYFCGAVSNVESGRFELKISKRKDYVRIILTGAEDLVSGIMKGWYEK
mgnify:CR=1 FL=1